MTSSPVIGLVPSIAPERFVDLVRALSVRGFKARPDRVIFDRDYFIVVEIEGRPVKLYTEAEVQSVIDTRPVEYR